MDELRLTGNCLKGSRPFLSFDAGFDSQPHLRLLKEMFCQVFNVPRGHPKSQPFFDHVLGFYLVDNKIWVRHYQVCASSGRLVAWCACGACQVTVTLLGATCLQSPWLLPDCRERTGQEDSEEGGKGRGRRCHVG